MTRVRDVLEEQRAAREPGERIVVDEVGQLLLAGYGLERERDVGCQLIEKRKLIRIEEPAAGGEQHDQGDAPIVCNER